MPTFDVLGQEFLLKLDGPLAVAVREECQVDLVPRLGVELELAKITEDPELLPRILWTLVRTQADSKGITREMFLGAVVGDVAEAAGLALAEAVVNFIPSRSRRETLRLALEQDRAAERAGLELAQAKLTALGQAQIEAVKSQVGQILDEGMIRLKSATASPGNLASLPKDAPGASLTGCAQEPGGEPANA